jgi:hypothetical protein
VHPRDGATVASNSAKELSAKAGVAGVTASTQAEVQDKLEKSYSKVSDANALEIIHDCRNKTAPRSEVAATPSQSESETHSAPAPSTRAYACIIESRRWHKVVTAGCDSDFIFTPTGGGVFTVNEVGCGNFHGTAYRHGDTLVVETGAGSTPILRYVWQLPTGTCAKASGTVYGLSNPALQRTATLEPIL